MFAEGLYVCFGEPIKIDLQKIIKNAQTAQPDLPFILCFEEKIKKVWFFVIFRLTVVSGLHNLEIAQTAHECVERKNSNKGRLI